MKCQFSMVALHTRTLSPCSSSYLPAEPNGTLCSASAASGLAMKARDLDAGYWLQVASGLGIFKVFSSSKLGDLRLLQAKSTTNTWRLHGADSVHDVPPRPCPQPATACSGSSSPCRSIWTGFCPCSHAVGGRPSSSAPGLQSRERRKSIKRMIRRGLGGDMDQVLRPFPCPATPGGTSL